MRPGEYKRDVEQGESHDYGELHKGAGFFGFERVHAAASYPALLSFSNQALTSS